MRERALHELSSREKRQVADELMMPTNLFAVVLMAAVLLLVFLFGAFSLFEPAQGDLQYNAKAVPTLSEEGG
jgi:hypothetical protein